MKTELDRTRAISVPLTLSPRVSNSNSVESRNSNENHQFFAPVVQLSSSNSTSTSNSSSSLSSPRLSFPRMTVDVSFVTRLSSESLSPQSPSLSSPSLSPRSAFAKFGDVEKKIKRVGWKEQLTQVKEVDSIIVLQTYNDDEEIETADRSTDNEEEEGEEEEEDGVDEDEEEIGAISAEEDEHPTNEEEASSPEDLTDLLNTHDKTLAPKRNVSNEKKLKVVSDPKPFLEDIRRYADDLKDLKLDPTFRSKALSKIRVFLFSSLLSSLFSLLSSLFSLLSALLFSLFFYLFGC